jgi:hypothetical protein
MLSKYTIPFQNQHAIIATPLDQRGHYRVSVDGRPLIASTRLPLVDAARELVRLGADPDAIIAMKQAGSDTVCIRARLAVAARLTVKETQNGPTFRRYVQTDESGQTGAPSLSERPSSAPEHEEGLSDGIDTERAPAEVTGTRRRAA